MSITYEVKTFIENYIDLIENENFDELYHKAVDVFRTDSSHVGTLTMALINSGIDPLKNLDYVPPFFCYGFKAAMRFTIPSNCKILSSFAFDESGLIEIEIKEGCERLQMFSLSNCELLRTVVLPKSLQYIESNTFNGSNELSELIYKSTKYDWHCIEKETNWYTKCHRLEKVICTDGEVQLPLRIS